MKRFQFCVWKFTKDRIFLNDLIYDGDAFIVVFKADDPVFNNGEYLHKKSIKHADFCKF